MADIVKGLQFTVDFEEGDVKSLRALKRRISDELKGLQKTLNSQLDELEKKAGNKTANRQLNKSIDETEQKVRELREAYLWVSRSIKDYNDLQKKTVVDQKAANEQKKQELKLQRDFNKELAEEQKIRRRDRRTDIDVVNFNRRRNTQAQRLSSFITKQNMSADIREILAMREKNRLEDMLQGQSSQLAANYFQSKLLEKYKGAQSRLSPDYFAEDGSKASLQRKLEQLNKLRDMKAPTSSGFKSLSAEIDATEKSLGRLTNRMSGDGMASFRKFSHMIFNITGLFFIASRGFEGMIKTLTRGAEFDTMRQAFQGTTQDIENMRKASRGLLSDEKIFAFSNKATDLGIKIKDQPIFIDMAIRSMKAYGGGIEKLDEILEKVIKSTETAQKELSSLGIKKVDFQKRVQELSKSLVQNNEKYELVNKSLEKTKKARKDYLLELDAEDQKTVKVQALLSLYGKTLKDVTDVEASRSDRILSISAHFENFTNTLSQRLLPVADIIFPMIIGFMNTVTGNADRLATALGVISAALAGLAVAMIGTGNPLGVLVAGLTAVLAAVAALETAYPSATSRILNANSEIASSIKDIVGAEKNLAEIRLDAQEKVTRAQGEEIVANEILLRQAKEKLRNESMNKFQAFDEKARDMSTGALDRYQNLKVGLLGYVSSLVPVLGALTPYLVMTSKNAEYVADNLNKADKEAQGFRMEVLNAVRDLVQFGQTTTVVTGLSAVLSRNTKLTGQLVERFNQLGNAGKAAFFGINAGILSSEAGLKNLSKISSLFTKAIALSKSTNPVDLQAASALFSAISGAVDALQNAYNQPGPTEKIPGVEDRTKKEKGKDRTKKEKGKDLDTVDEKLRLILDKYQTWQERQKAINGLFGNLGELIDAQVSDGSALEYFNMVMNPVAGELKPGQAIEEILKLQNTELDNVLRNTKENLTEEQRSERIAAAKKKILEAINGILADQKQKVEDVTRAEIEQLDVIVEEKVSFSDAVKKVADSMRDASKDWNPGIKGLMTYFEMAEIAVRGLADTLTSELGQAWENIFGEANSLFEKFIKNVITKIAEILLVRGIAKLLSILFPGVGVILGAGLATSTSGGGGGGGDSLGRGITNTYLANRVDARPINIYLAGTLDGQTFLKKAMPQYENFNQAIRIN